MHVPHAHAHTSSALLLSDSLYLSQGWTKGRRRRRLPGWDVHPQLSDHLHRSSTSSHFVTKPFAQHCGRCCSLQGADGFLHCVFSGCLFYLCVSTGMLSTCARVSSTLRTTPGGGSLLQCLVQRGQLVRRLPKTLDGCNNVL